MLCRYAFNNFCEGIFRIAQRYAILRPFRASNGGLYGAEVELQRAIKIRSGGRIGAEKHLFFAVGFDERDLLNGPRRETQVIQCLGIDRKEPHGRAVFRSHVGDGRAIRNAQGGKSRAVKFHKFSDHSMFAQHFRYREDQIGSGGALV